MKALIVLNGEPPGEALLAWRAEEADYVVAADGGAAVLIEAGLRPDLVVGDMDSFDPDSFAPPFPPSLVRREPDQDSTDLEKALHHLPGEEPPEEIILLGATGGRSDHFLTNLLVASAIPEETRVALDADDEFIERVTPARPVRIVGRKGSVVSLLPFATAEGVTTDGLRWELSEARLGPGLLLGQSNEAVKEEVRVSMTGGRLFVILPKDAPS